MKIRMLRSVPGSENGTDTRLYSEGQVYELGVTAGARDLAAVFLREGWAVPEEATVTEERAMPPPENKAIPMAPRNKGRMR